MADLLKNLYNDTFFDELCPILAGTLSRFHRSTFMDEIYDSDWKNRELKARMKHLAEVLAGFLPDDYPEAVEEIKYLIKKVENSPLSECRLEFMFVTEYVEKYGLDHFEASAGAMEFITQFTSCEFAVRPFILKYEERMIQQMLNWTQHNHSHVRRLASEGCRPRLPWAMALPRFKKDPKPILPILENLKDDSSEFVRRSVANNLNDISKDHPELVLETGKRWIIGDANRGKIIKHACRTMLKSGDIRALELFGFYEPSDIEILNFECGSSVVMGETLEFSFIVKNGGQKKSKVRIEYGVDYMKSNGSTNRKIFQISETVLKPGELKDVRRTQSFKELTTRKHYPGMHSLAILVNGREFVKSGFMVSG